MKVRDKEQEIIDMFPVYVKAEKKPFTIPVKPIVVGFGVLTACYLIKSLFF